MHKMIKTDAINIIARNGLPLSSRNTVFSNINSDSPVWRLEPNNKKFDADLYIILNDNTKNTLYVFYITAGTFPAPQKTFYQRNDRGCSHIKISIGSHSFADKKNKIHFSKYLINNVTYKLQ